MYTNAWVNLSNKKAILIDIKAAVIHSQGEGFNMDSVPLAEPEFDETRVKFDQINQAFEDAASGVTIKPVLKVS